MQRNLTHFGRTVRAEKKSYEPGNYMKWKKKNEGLFSLRLCSGILSVCIMEQWSMEHQTFTCEMFFKNNESYVQTIRLFCLKFDWRPRDSVPSRNTMKLWVKNFLETTSVSKKKPPGSVRSARTPENTERVWQALITSPRRLGVKHAVVLDISRWSFIRIVKDSAYHPYKIMLTQELKHTDYTQRLNFAQKMRRKLESGEIMRNTLFISTRQIFIETNLLTNRIVGTMEPTICISYTRNRTTQNALLCGAG